MSGLQSSFTLIAVTSRDGFITGPKSEPPGMWASPEEQLRFAATVSALDWAFIGRLTHTIAWRPDRRRVVFSRSFRTATWRHPKRLWVDPATVSLPTILETIAAVHPPEHCGILGGLAVHDWFAERGLIDAAEITIEPLTFGHGLPLLSGDVTGDPLASIARLGLVETAAITLNAQGTRLHRFTRPASRFGHEARRTSRPPLAKAAL